MIILCGNIVTFRVCENALILVMNCFKNVFKPKTQKVLVVILVGKIHVCLNVHPKWTGIIKQKRFSWFCIK